MKKKKPEKRSRERLAVDNRSSTNPLVEAFALRMKEWRQAKGLTLKTVAADTGLSMAILCEWEHGHRFPSVDHLWAISQYTRIPAWELIRSAKGTTKNKGRRR